ncbi:MAG: hypothetical protein ABI039_04310 [Vicinamibacterales bacterium]
MTSRLTLTITSMLSIVLFALHWFDEVARGLESGTVDGLGGVLILVVWMYGTLELRDRPSGYIIKLLGGILAFGVLVLHMSGRGLTGGRIPANSDGVLFWVSTAIALGATGLYSLILSATGLWSLWKGKAPKANQLAELR